MPTSKKSPTSPKKKRAITTAKKHIEAQSDDTSFVRKIGHGVKRFVARIVRRKNDFLARRPHRSFRQTRRRDYVRSLKLPGYWSFTNYVRKTLWQQKKAFGWMILIYLLLTIGLIGIASQETYAQISDTLRSTSGDILQGGWGEIGKAGLLLASGATGALSAGLTESQQIYSVILALLAWLTTVWLLRSVLAGHKPKMRDGLYNAGAPIVATFLVALVVLVQLLPVGIAMIGFTAALSSGLLDGGVEAMVFWLVASLLLALSLYWITSTLIALVVVTLPGMYPMRAVKIAGDLVIGRRVRIMLRMIWLFFTVAATWVIVMIPIILFDAWLKGVWTAVDWLPIVPSALLVMSTFTVVWMASYIYLLYRKVVDDDTAPA